MERIISFDGEFAFLSNFWPWDKEQGCYVADPLAIPFGETVADTVEHAFQAVKTTSPEWRQRILDADRPGKAKFLGQQAPLRSDWEQRKVTFMHELLRRKFSDPFLAAKLLSTEDAELIEGNTWNDTFWGVCRGEGENWLGRLLMEVRQELAIQEEG